MYKCNIVDKNLFNVLCSTFKVWKKQIMPHGVYRLTPYDSRVSRYLLFTIDYRLPLSFDLIDVFCPADYYKNLTVLDFIVCRYHLDPVREGISDGNDINVVFAPQM